jgi:hypothetical protein
MRASLSGCRLAAVVFVAVLPAARGGQHGSDVPGGHTISGRVVDPQGLRPEGAILMLGQADGPSSFRADPVAVAPDGSFVTPRRAPGVYILEVVRTPHSATQAETPVGQSIVDLSSADRTGVTVTVRPDTALTGRFRMESDDPKAVWPSQINVMAFVAVDGQPMVSARAAQGGPNGTFVLRNAYGPRVLRCGYALGPDASPWWFSRVVLDGRDVTNVPIDFGEHPHSQLEVVFTQHPAGLAGAAIDPQGRPANMPWVLVTGSDAASAQAWATTSAVTQATPSGRFFIPMPPGRYRLNAVPAATFSSREAARSGMARIVFGGVTAVVKARETTVVNVTLQER